MVSCTGITQVHGKGEKTLKQFKKSMEASGQKNGFVAKKAKEYIDSNYTNSDISVASIADMLEITANYMSQVFKKEYGTGLLDYLTKLRIEHTCSLLIDTNLSLKRIASEVGFSNERAFSRSFAKIKGLNPGKYRLAHGNDKNE